MKGKTRDGLKIGKILGLVRKLEGVGIKDGTRHAILLTYENLMPCAIAESTNARYHLVPWLQKATSYHPNQIYDSLKKGNWTF